MMGRMVLSGWLHRSQLLALEDFLAEGHKFDQASHQWNHYGKNQVYLEKEQENKG